MVSLVIGLMPLNGFLCKTFQSPSALTPGQLSASTGMVSTSSHERSVNQQTPRETQGHPMRLFAPGILWKFKNKSLHTLAETENTWKHIINTYSSMQEELGAKNIKKKRHMLQDSLGQPRANQNRVTTEFHIYITTNHDIPFSLVSLTPSWPYEPPPKEYT